MSIDLNWEAVTTGPDGDALAENIRDFIHTKFQAVPLPRFIKSVVVHEFEFGSVPPSLELKDITDPLPDFYEENSEDGEDSDDDDDDDDGDWARRRDIVGGAGSSNTFAAGWDAHPSPPLPKLDPERLVRTRDSQRPDLTSPFLGVSTPGILGGASNLHYFQTHLSNGTQTPLAAVAGAHMPHSRHESLELPTGMTGAEKSPNPSASQSGIVGMGTGSGSGPATYARGAGPGPGTGTFPRQGQGPKLRTAPGTETGERPNPRPPTLTIPMPGHHRRNPSHGSVSTGGDFSPGVAPSAMGGKSSMSTPTKAASSAGTPSQPRTRGGDKEEIHQKQQQQEQARRQKSQSREPRPEDMQAVFRIRYAGNVRLNLTAEILLDYPMPSFVSIPVRLSITGLTFDGVGVLAHIRRRAHFCFLGPEDAVAVVGGHFGGDAEDGGEGEEESDEGGAGWKRRSMATGGSGGGCSGSGGGDDEIRGGSCNKQDKPGGLLREIKVDSEIGLREGGKQSLRNVGKVEKFVLEQVRRIFEDELVYPSYWTFLV